MFISSSNPVSTKFKYAADHHGSGSITGDNFYNPSDVLIIEPRLKPIVLDLSESRNEDLGRQMDRLLSPKHTYLSTDPEFLQKLIPFEHSLRQGLMELHRENANSTYVSPILEKLAALRELLVNVNHCTDIDAFNVICSALIKPSYELEQLEKLLLYKLFKWSGTDAKEMEKTLAESGLMLEPESSSDVTNLDDQVEALLKGQGFQQAKDHDDVHVLNPFDLEVRQAVSSIVNHRLGNLPLLSSQISTYCTPEAFYDCAQDRAALISVVDVKVNHFRYLDLFMVYGANAKFATIIEWAQHRLPKI